MANLHYLGSIFNVLNELNISMQGKGGDVFVWDGKIEALKIKLSVWRSHVVKNKFCNFPLLHEYIKTWDLEGADKNLIETVKTVIENHLELLMSNFELYFPSNQNEDLNKSIWVINPFNVDITHTTANTTTENVLDCLMDLNHDLLQKSSFKSFTYYGDYWVSLFEFENYKKNL